MMLASRKNMLRCWAPIWSALWTWHLPTCTVPARFALLVVVLKIFALVCLKNIGKNIRKCSAYQWRWMEWELYATATAALWLRLRALLIRPVNIRKLHFRDYKNSKSISSSNNNNNGNCHWILLQQLHALHNSNGCSGVVRLGFGTCIVGGMSVGRQHGLAFTLLLPLLLVVVLLCQSADWFIYINLLSVTVVIVSAACCCFCCSCCCNATCL